MSKVFALQMRGSDPGTHVQMLGEVVHTCNLSSGEGENGGSLGLTGQCNLIGELQGNKQTCPRGRGWCS